VIIRDANGQIDKEAAVAALAARRQPAKAIRRGRPADTQSAALSIQMLKSRIKTEIERGRLAELDRRQREGELVESREVEETAFSAARNLRDAIVNIPSRVSTLFAGESNPVKIHKILEEELRRALTDLVDATETQS
jgi:hypothetical protein